MKKETLKRIFEFLETKEGLNAPLIWKHINNIPLTEEDLIIKGDLELWYSKIESLPKGLEVGGNLTLFYASISSLPKGLKVGGDLMLTFTEITSLPEGLEVGGDLVLNLSSIASLPEGLEVGGDLYIRNTPLTKYTNQELIEMLKLGFIKGTIRR